MRDAIDIVQRMLDETIEISHRVMDNSVSYETFATQSPPPPGFLGPSPFHASIRSTLDSVIGQRLSLLSEIKSELIYAYSKQLELDKAQSEG